MLPNFCQTLLAYEQFCFCFVTLSPLWDGSAKSLARAGGVGGQGWGCTTGHQLPQPAAGHIGAAKNKQLCKLKLLGLFFFYLYLGLILWPGTRRVGVRETKLWMESCRWPVKGNLVPWLLRLLCVLSASCGALSSLRPPLKICFLVMPVRYRSFYNHFSCCLLLSLWYIWVSVLYVVSRIVAVLWWKKRISWGFCIWMLSAGLESQPLWSHST